MLYSNMTQYKLFVNLLNQITNKKAVTPNPHRDPPPPKKKRKKKEKISQTSHKSIIFISKRRANTCEYS